MTKSIGRSSVEVVGEMGMSFVKGDDVRKQVRVVSKRRGWVRSQGAHQWVGVNKFTAAEQRRQ